MKCPYCGKDGLKDDYIYCPYCGKQIRKPIQQVMKEAVEDFMSFVKPILSAFNIQIKEVSPKEIQKQLEKPGLKPPKKEVVEPEVAMKREGGKVFIEVMLPGVKSERDIYLYEMEESVEVRADTKNKTYFRVISLPKNTRVLSTKFENEKLQIVLW